MKNIFKIMMIAIVIVLAFVGCGTKSSKLKAKITKEDIRIGEYEIKIEITFTNDAPSSVKTTNNLHSRDLADNYYNIMSSLYANDSNVSVEKSGDSVTVNQKKITESSEYYGMSKSSIKETLENAGWEIE